MYNPSSSIIDELASQNIHIDWQSQKILPDQGLMSHVLEVSSNSGMLILHRIPLNTTHLEWDLQKKYEILKEFFIKYTIPHVPEYLFLWRESLSLFTLQRKIVGTSAGKRTIKNGKIYDIFFERDHREYFTLIERFLGQLHEYNGEGGGPIDAFSYDTLIGKYPAWKDYLESHIGNWASLCSCEEIELSLLKKILNSIDPREKSTLIHGDIINPSNVLIQKDDIIGVIDWEWSLLADPAWEFADIGWKAAIRETHLETYFLYQGIHTHSEKKDFLARIEKYHILWLLWGASMHHDDIDKTLYNSLIGDFRIYLHSLLSSHAF